MHKTRLAAIGAAAVIVVGGGTGAALASTDAATVPAPSNVVTVPAPSIVYGCITDGTGILEDSTTSKADFEAFLAANNGKCPGGSSVTIGAPDTSPTGGGSPTPTPSDSSTPTPTPTGSGGDTPPPSGSCTVAPGDSCGPYTDSNVYDSDVDSDYVANQGLAENASDYQGNLTASGLGDWTASVNVTDDNGGGVEGYPADNINLSQAGTATSSDQYPYYPEPLSDFTDVTSDFASTFPHTSGTSAESAYDVWTDPVGTDIYGSGGWNQETMIWTDQYNRFNDDPNGNPVACGYDSGAQAEATGVTFPTMPGLTWDLCLYGTPPGQPGANTGDNSEWIWYLPGQQEDSGTVDIQAMIQYEIDHGDLPSDIGYTQINYGFETVATSGTENFTVSKFTLSGDKASSNAASVPPAGGKMVPAVAAKAKTHENAAEKKSAKVEKSAKAKK